MTVRDKAEREVAARTAKLKALRLAKEAADKLAAEEAAAASPPPKTKKAKAKVAPAGKPAKRMTRTY